MLPRDRLIRACRREKPDRMPKELDFTVPSVLEKFKQITGQDDPYEYFDMEMRFIDFTPTKLKCDFTLYHKDLPQGTTIDEWGIAYVPGSSYHFTKMQHPLANCSTVEELDNYPMPDFPEDYRHIQTKVQADEIKSKGFASVARWHCTLFERAWYLRGLENIFVDMLTNQAFANKLFDKVIDISVRQTCQYAKAGVDIIQLGDDVGSQRGPIMSPEMYRKWIKPRHRKVIQEIKKINPDVIVWYHTDGNVEDFIPDFIEIGIDVLNPVQPECMDPAEIKKKYGEKIAFWGTISVQQTLPFGTPEDVRREVKERIDTVGEGGGLVIAPSHVIEPEVPWENIMAFYEAVNEHGKY